MPYIKINDGGKTYGSPALAIDKYNGSAWVSRGTYITEDFSFDQAVNEKVFEGADTEPVGQVIVKGRVTGRATALIGAADTMIEFSDKFTYDSETYLITSVGQARTKNDERKVPITFAKMISASINSVTLS